MIIVTSFYGACQLKVTFNLQRRVQKMLQQDHLKFNLNQTVVAQVKLAPNFR